MSDSICREICEQIVIVQCSASFFCSQANQNNVILVREHGYTQPRRIYKRSVLSATETSSPN